MRDNQSKRIARKILACAVLAVASQVLVWCVVFAAAAFFREIQFDPRATWEGVREFATNATLVIDGIVFGVGVSLWALLELEVTSHAG